MLCKKCGQELTDGQEICPDCGTRIKSKNKQPNNNVDLDEKKKYMNKNRIPKIISLIVSILDSLVWAFIFAIVLKEENETTIIIIGVFFVMSIIILICSFLMQNRKSATIIMMLLSVILFVLLLGQLGPIFAVILLINIIAGIVNLCSIHKAKKAVLQKTTIEFEDTKVEESIENTTENITLDTTADNEAVQTAKVGDGKPTKKQLVIFGVVIIYYLFILIIGILGMVSGTDILWSAENIEVEKALNVVTGFTLIATIPTFGVYFATCTPFQVKSKTRIWIAAISVVLLIILDIVFFPVKSTYADVLKTSAYVSESGFIGRTLSDNTMLTIAQFISQIGILAIYALKFIHIPYHILLKKPSVDKGYTGFKLIFSNIFSVIINSCKAIMRLKERNFTLFSLLGTVAFTLGLFVAINLIVGGIILLVVLGIIFFCVHIYSSNIQPHNVYTIYDGGYKLTLTYYEYNLFLSADIYKDEHGRQWLTRDSGATFQKHD